MTFLTTFNIALLMVLCIILIYIKALQVFEDADFVKVLLLIPGTYFGIRCPKLPYTYGAESLILNIIFSNMLMVTLFYLFFIIIAIITITFQNMNK